MDLHLGPDDKDNRPHNAIEAWLNRTPRGYANDDLDSRPIDKAVEQGQIPLRDREWPDGVNQGRLHRLLQGQPLTPRDTNQVLLRSSLSNRPPLVGNPTNSYGHLPNAASNIESVEQRRQSKQPTNKQVRHDSTYLSTTVDPQPYDDGSDRGEQFQKRPRHKVRKDKYNINLSCKGSVAEKNPSSKQEQSTRSQPSRRRGAHELGCSKEVVANFVSDAIAASQVVVCWFASCV